MIMKYLFILLIFIYKIEAIKYINFIPFTNPDCTPTTVTNTNSGEGSSSGNIDSGNEGVGYSIVVDTCFSFDNSTNHIVGEKDGNVHWQNFYNILDADSCMISQDAPINIVLGKCTSAVESNLFNSFYFSLGQQLFYMTTVSDQPMIPSNSFVTSFMSGECTDQDVLLVEYVINGTQIGYGSKSKVVNYFCDSEHQPYTQLCPGGNQCFKPTSSLETCIKTKSFYNDSSEITSNSGSGDGGNSIISDVSSTLSSTSSPSSSSSHSSVTVSSSSGSGGDGPSTGGSGSGHTSGSGGPSSGSSGGSSGVSSGSGGSSGGLFKININVNNNNQIISSTSSSPSSYYKSVYCTK